MNEVGNPLGSCVNLMGRSANEKDYFKITIFHSSNVSRISFVYTFIADGCTPLARFKTSPVKGTCKP